MNIFAFFSIVVDFWKLKINLEKSRDRKWWSSKWYIYEHQINWANLCNNNVIASKWFDLFNVQPISERMKNSTLYLSNQFHMISYELHKYMPCRFPSLSSLLLLILLLLSICQPCQQFSYCHCCVCVLIINCTRYDTNNSNFFRVFLKTS